MKATLLSQSYRHDMPFLHIAEGSITVLKPDAKNYCPRGGVKVYHGQRAGNGHSPAAPNQRNMEMRQRAFGRCGS